MADIKIEGEVCIDDEWELPLKGANAGDLFESLVRKYASDAIAFALTEREGSNAGFDVDFKDIVFSIPLLARGGDTVFLHADFLAIIADEIEVIDSDACGKLKATLVAGITLIDVAIARHDEGRRK